MTDSLYTSHEGLHLYNQRILDSDLHHNICTFFLPWHHDRVLEALRRYSKAGKDEQNKESPRSVEKILESEESTAKIKKVFNSTPL